METETNDRDKRKRTPTDEANISGEESSSTRNAPDLTIAASGPTPKRVACIQCRQSKLRCDSPKDPCSRCARLGLPCTKDKGYRRINKRSKIDDLEKVVMQLQARVNPDLNPTPNQSSIPSLAPWAGLPVSRDGVVESTITDNAGTYSQQSEVHPHESLLTPSGDIPLATQALQSEPILSRPSATKARALDSTALGANEIDVLFDLYFNHFHPFFPLLNAVRSPDLYYERSQFLFWIIISVASRRYSADPGLQPMLAKTVIDMSWKVIADPPLTYASVQGILILCMWPPSITHLWSDASTALSSIAMVAAMHMGLHRPDHIREFTRNPRGGGHFVITEADKLERNKTWAACNIVSHYTVIHIGYPPTVSCFDWSVERACETGNPHSAPDELRYHLIIQRFCYRTTKAMSDNISDSLGLPSDDQFDTVMRMLDLDLVTLEGQVAGKLSIIDKITLRGARLQLELQWWQSRVWTDQKRKGILKCYNTASTLIKEVVSADLSFQVLLYAPITYPRMLFNSAYVIMRLIHSTFSKWVDCAAGEALFNSAVSCILRYSCQEMDISARAAGILQEVWDNRDEIFINDKNTEPSLMSRSRLAGSMTFDCLWRWKEKYPNKRVGTGPYRPVNSWVPPEVETQGASTVEPFDPIASTFEWTMFDDFDWPWTLDGPSVLEA